METDRFGDVQAGLQSIISSVEKKQAYDPDVFEKCWKNIVDPFLFNYVNNLASYCGQLIALGGEYKTIGLRLIVVLNEMCTSRNITHNQVLKNLMNKLPFMDQYTHDGQQVIASVLKAFATVRLKDIDLASQGKIDFLPSVDIDQGSVK